MEYHTTNLGKTNTAETFLNTKTVENMDSATANMASHLLPVGILVIEPWITTESWIVGKAGSSTAEA